MIRRHSSYKIFFSNKTVLQRHGLSGMNKDPVTLSKIRNYILRSIGSTYIQATATRGTFLLVHFFRMLQGL